MPIISIAVANEDKQLTISAHCRATRGSESGLSFEQTSQERALTLLMISEHPLNDSGAAFPVIRGGTFDVKTHAYYTPELSFPFLFQVSVRSVSLFTLKSRRVQGTGIEQRETSDRMVAASVTPVTATAALATTGAWSKRAPIPFSRTTSCKVRQIACQFGESDFSSLNIEARFGQTSLHPVGRIRCHL